MGESVVLVKNTEYYDADKVSLNKITFRYITDLSTALLAYESGEIEGSRGFPLSDYARLNADNAGIVSVPSYGTVFYNFNCAKAPFDNVLVRKAFNLAIDRSALINDVVQIPAEPAYSMAFSKEKREQFQARISKVLRAVAVRTGMESCTLALYNESQAVSAYFSLIPSLAAANASEGCVTLDIGGGTVDYSFCALNAGRPSNARFDSCELGGQRLVGEYIYQCAVKFNQGKTKALDWFHEGFQAVSGNRDSNDAADIQTFLDDLLKLYRGPKSEFVFCIDHFISLRPAIFKEVLKTKHFQTQYQLFLFQLTLLLWFGYYLGLQGCAGNFGNVLRVYSAGNGSNLFKMIDDADNTRLMHMFTTLGGKALEVVPSRAPKREVVEGLLRMSRPVNICSGQFGDMPTETLFETMHSIGYDGLEVATQSHIDVDRIVSDSDYRKEYQSLLHKHHMQIGALSGHLAGQCVGDRYDSRLDNFVPASLKGKPDEIRQWAVTRMKTIAKAAQLLDVPVVTCFLGSPIWAFWYSFPQTTPEMVEQGFQTIRELWSPIFDEYDRCGVKLALEVHPTEIAFDYYSTLRLLETLEYRPTLGLNFDPSHLLWQGVNPTVFLRDFAKRIYHVHLKDVRINHAAGGYSRATAKSLKLDIGDNIVIHLNVHFHNVATLRVTNGTGAGSILNFANIAGVFKMIHYFFGIHSGFLLAKCKLLFLS